MKIFEIDHRHLGNKNITELDALSYSLITKLRNPETPVSDREKLIALLNLCEQYATITTIANREECRFIVERLDTCRELIYSNALDTDDKL